MGGGEGVSDGVLREGDAALARLAERFDATEVIYGLTNIGDGWTVTLSRHERFTGATAEEAVDAALRPGRVR